MYTRYQSQGDFKNDHKEVYVKSGITVDHSESET